MTDDFAETPEGLQRQHAYVDEIRKIARRERAAGFLCCLIGSVSLIAISIKLEKGAASLPGYVALGVIMLGWVLFVYAIVKRTRYVRAHPFDPSI